MRVGMAGGAAYGLPPMLLPEHPVDAVWGAKMTHEELLKLAGRWHRSEWQLDMLTAPIMVELSDLLSLADGYLALSAKLEEVQAELKECYAQFVAGKLGQASQHVPKAKGMNAL